MTIRSVVVLVASAANLAAQKSRTAKEVERGNLMAEQDATLFQFAREFVAACDRAMTSSVSLIDGDIFIRIRMQDVKLTPRGSSGLPPGDTVGTWKVSFRLRPLLEADDLQKIQNMESRSRPSKNAQTNIFGAELRTATHSFELVLPNRLPTDAENIKRVSGFVERLSKSVTLANGEDSREFLKDRILSPERGPGR
jgi:hypothetical protein